MNLRDFKFWFEGFNEAIFVAPTPEQWKKIKEMVSLIREPFSIRIEEPMWTVTQPEFPTQNNC